MIRILAIFTALLLMWMLWLATLSKGPTMAQASMSIFALAVTAIVSACLMEKE